MAKKDTTQLTYAQFSAAISVGNSGNASLFYGEENYLLLSSLRRLKEKLIDPVAEEFNYHRFTTENFSGEALLNCAENLPMLGQRTMLQVDDVDLFALPEEERKQVIALLADLPPYCCVVFAYWGIPYKPDGRMRNLSAAIKQHVQLVEFQKQGEKALIAWIARHFQRRGKVISRDLSRYLIALTGGFMFTLDREIEKIAAYAQEPEIRQGDIDAVTEPVLDIAVFRMTDDLGDGNYFGALQKLHVLLENQQEPISILGAVGAHFRRLSAARILGEAGYGIGDLMRLTGTPEFIAKRAMPAARRFSPQFLRRAMAMILETDMQLKTSYDRPERLLELLLLQLAQEAQHG